MTVKEISEIAGLSDPALALVQEDSTPGAYLDSLEKQELYQDAIRFLAHKLAPDVGVKWASACVQELQAPENKEQKNEVMEAVDRWVKTPDDSNRWAAKQEVDQAKTSSPANLVAMAVFLSGGSIAPPPAPETMPPPYAAQKMIAGSVVVTVVSYQPEKAPERYKRALAMGRELDK